MLIAWVCEIVGSLEFKYTLRNMWEVHSPTRQNKFQEELKIEKQNMNRNKDGRLVGALRKVKLFSRQLKMQFKCKSCGKWINIVELQQKIDREKSKVQHSKSTDVVHQGGGSAMLVGFKGADKTL